MARVVSLPLRANNPNHLEFGKQFLEGDWEETTDPFVLDSPPGSVCFSRGGGFTLWICDGKGHWAGVGDDGCVLGFIPTFTGGFMARRVDAVKVVPVAPAAPASSSSSWNGRCPACGLGTYTGLFQTQHEGGGCPKA